MNRLGRGGGGFAELFRNPYAEFGQIQKLQKFLTKIRFIKYRPDYETRRVVPLESAPGCLLIHDGNLRGPRYDPARYIRQIYSAGCIPIHINSFNQRTIAEVLDVRRF